VTVVVAFYCSDGVVVAADSMLTSSIGTAAGPVGVGHHTGVKCSVIAGEQIFAWSGNPGLAARFRMHAEMVLPGAGASPNALLHSVGLCQRALQDFVNTGVPPAQVDLATVLAYLHNGDRHCCVFTPQLQPRLLDADHFYVALGSGMLSADPFLRFVSDTFCEPGKPPRVHLATFLAVWVVQHVIDVNPGGVAGPIRVSVFERNAAGNGFNVRELPATDIEAHVAAIDDAAGALRAWRNNIQSGAAAGGVTAPPAAPAAGAIAIQGAAPAMTQAVQPNPAPAAPNAA
jgi:hypothetical protein